MNGPQMVCALGNSKAVFLSVPRGSSRSRYAMSLQQSRGTLEILHKTDSPGHGTHKRHRQTHARADSSGQRAAYPKEVTGRGPWLCPNSCAMIRANQFAMIKIRRRC
jgi:hypothetical protein